MGLDRRGLRDPARPARAGLPHEPGRAGQPAGLRHARLLDQPRGVDALRRERRLRGRRVLGGRHEREHLRGRGRPRQPVRRRQDPVRGGGRPRARRAERRVGPHEPRLVQRRGPMPERRRGAALRLHQPGQVLRRHFRICGRGALQPGRRGVRRLHRRGLHQQGGHHQDGLEGERLGRPARPGHLLGARDQGAQGIRPRREGAQGHRQRGEGLPRRRPGAAAVQPARPRGREGGLGDRRGGPGRRHARRGGVPRGVLRLRQGRGEARPHLGAAHRGGRQGHARCRAPRLRRRPLPRLQGQPHRPARHGRRDRDQGPEGLPPHRRQAPHRERHGGGHRRGGHDLRGARGRRRRHPRRHVARQARPGTRRDGPPGRRLARRHLHHLQPQRQSRHGWREDVREGRGRVERHRGPGRRLARDARGPAALRNLRGARDRARHGLPPGRGLVLHLRGA